MGDRSNTSSPDLAPVLAAELRGVFGKLRRQLRAQGAGDDLTASQKTVLLRLEKHGPATVSSLARAEGMRPQSMSAIVTALQAAHAVSGAPDPNDGRQTLMSLTKKYEKRLREGRAARQDWLTAAIRQKLSMQEQEKLAKSVELLLRLCED